MNAYTSHVSIPADVPCIGLEVRLVNGVPCVFTERGEFVRGQIAVSIKGEVDSIVEADLHFRPERK